MVDAVGQKRRLRPDAKPASQADAPLEIVEHGEFMVAGQADALDAGGARCGQMIEHLRGGGTAVDIIAQHDDQLVPGQLGCILDDVAFERQQGVETAMHVANGVNHRVGHIQPKARQRRPAFVQPEKSPDALHRSAPITPWVPTEGAIRASIRAC